ncbi:hypothetical protein GCM10027176_30820 [Actinoallomurus bryophytorum]|uniref:hypothetical protein n=1 Tax=Actinoallomurus bryophytorum TaxID=1490222 RepID=UPI001152F510|nr:hypothetical protein [Actinoallomurus bryophytorum]
MVLLGVAALYVGTWRLWALTVLLWSLYELCFCPTTCGIATGGGAVCRNATHGRLFACTHVPGHQRSKTDALWRPTVRHEPGSRPRLPQSDGAPAAHRRARLTPSRASIAPRQRLMAYAAVIGLAVTVVQTAVGLAGPW